MTTKSRTLSATLLLVSAVMLISCTACSLRRSEASIRASLLRRVPVGTSRDTLETFLQKKEWEHQSAAGFTRPILETDTKSRPEVRESVSAQLGYYREGLLYAPETLVWATWLMDTNNRVLDIWVWKYTHAGF